MASILQRTARFVFRQISKQVKKNDLFEQRGERQKQPPISFEDPASQGEIPNPKEVQLSRAADIQRMLQGHEGWLIVNHGASWCDGCIEELPVLRSLYEQASQKGIEMVGISWELFEGGGPEAAVQMVSHCIEEYKISFGSWVLLDDPSTAFEALSIGWQKIPQTWLLRNGVSVYKHEGLLRAADIETLLNNYVS